MCFSNREITKVGGNMNSEEKGLLLRIFWTFMRDKRDGWVNYVFWGCQKALHAVLPRRLVKSRTRFPGRNKRSFLRWVENYLNEREEKTHVKSTFSTNN